MHLAESLLVLHAQRGLHAGHQLQWLFLGLLRASNYLAALAPMSEADRFCSICTLCLGGVVHIQAADCALAGVCSALGGALLGAVGAGLLVSATAVLTTAGGGPV